MKSSIIETISGVIHAPKFQKFIDGTQLTLINGMKLFIKVESTHRSIRPVGFRFSKFSFVTAVRIGDFIGYGYGEAENELIAFEKSIAEGVERVVFKFIKANGSGTLTSNGWAAHFSEIKAKTNALEELMERDAVLVHWFSQKPMFEIDSKTFPQWLKIWVKNELSQAPTFKKLRVLISHQGHLPSITTVFENSLGHAVMSHAGSKNIETALYKALAETCRISKSAQEEIFIESSKKMLSNNANFEESRPYPEDHAMIYAHHLKFPDWIFGEEKTWSVCKKMWTNKYSEFAKTQIKFKFQEVVKAPLSIGYGECSEIQDMFFGTTQMALNNGLINLERLKIIGGGEKINLLPHCVA